MRKRLLFCIAVLVMIGLETIALAENETFGQEMLNAIGRIEVWKAELADLHENISGENAVDMVRYGSNVLSMLQGIALTHDPSGEIVSTALNEMVPRDALVLREKNGTIIQTPVYWSSEVGSYVSCEFLFRNGYLSGRFSLYSLNGDYLATQYLEIGRRNEELMIAVVDYDRIDNLTGRFAMKEADNYGNVIFTKTTGCHLDIVLDVDVWQRGTEMEWNKNLLLPATVMYQE